MHASPLSFFLGAVTSAAAVSAALLCVGTADAFLPPLFRANDIEYRGAYRQHDDGDGNIINETHSYALRAYSAFCFLLVFTIIAVKIAAMPRTISQPTMGIQAAPKLPPVRRVPKKNTRKPTVYPTEN